VIYDHKLDIRFVRIADWSSFFIGIKETGGLVFTHVGVLTDPDENGVRYEYGARLHVDGSLTGRPGVQRRPLDYAKFEYQEPVSIPVTAWEHEHFWLAMDRVAGERYSQRSIFGIAVHFDFRDEHGFICSSLVDWGFYHAEMLPHELRGSERLLTPMDDYYLCLGLRDGRNVAIN